MTTIARNLEPVLPDAARHYPVVTLTGPRQSGKTTLCRTTFPALAYVSLEPLDTRAFARTDPRGFLRAYGSGAVIDEVQRAPELPSYIQEAVDARPEPGRFILTGSQHLGLSAAVAQSLAGRTAILFLLPLAMDELRRFPDAPTDLFGTLAQGAFPRIVDQGVPAARWLADYVATSLERDVRQVLDVGDLLAFGTFIRHAAARTAQEVNLSALGADAGVTHPTARKWLAVLEAIFACHRLPHWHRNVRKRLVKAPKLHFVDSGVACGLLGIHEPAQLVHHPLRGPLFECWVVAEVAKARMNRGRSPDLLHYRESGAIEVDLVLDLADRLVLTEIKSGATIATDWLAPLVRLRDELRALGEAREIELRVVHGGDAAQERDGVQLIPGWHVASAEW